MEVCARPVPETDDFIELIGQFGPSDIAMITEDIQAYELGKTISARLEDLLQRAECLAEANRIMSRIRLVA